MPTPPQLVLRTFEERDRPAIDAMSAEVVRDGTVFPFEDTAGVAGYWFGPGTHVVVAEGVEGVVGAYTLKPNHAGRGAHVANAGYMVSEHARGRGVGRALGEHSLEAARALGYRAVQFNQVVATNESAVRLWDRLGFTVIGRSPQAFRHSALGLVDTLIMYRTLA